MNNNESLKWRSAIKKFDPTKKVSAENLDTVLESANLAATSMGLQPFKMVVVTNESLKNELVEHSYNQTQVAEASHLLVFATETNVGENTIQDYIERVATTRNQPKEQLEGYSNMMKGYISSMDANAKAIWAKNQAFIAVGTVLSTLADLRIDSCPMEGINPLKYQELLDLKDKNLMPVLALPIGYRSEEDHHSKENKVRKTKNEFVLEIA